MYLVINGNKSLFRCGMFLVLASGCISTDARSPTDPGSRFRDCPACPVMVVVPGSSFEMGYEPSEARPETDAVPVHTVTIRDAFAVGAHEVSRAEFEAFVSATGYTPKDECNIYETEWWFVKPGVNWRNPGYAQSDNDPVVCVTWSDTQAYVQWLGRITGHEYRLLTESEWEYIARTGRGNQAVDDISHDFANYGAKECCGPMQQGRDRFTHTAPVGSFPADALGLFDVRGNVWEWVADCYHDSYVGAPADGSARSQDCSHPDNRVVRGGGWGDDVFYLRAAYRLRAPEDNGYFTLGFRVARNLDETRR